MKKKSSRKKIGSQIFVRSTAAFVLVLCIALISGTAWFFMNTLDALTLAQKGGAAKPPKITVIDPQLLDKVLKAAADRRADSNKLMGDYRNPFELPAVPPAPAVPAAPVPPLTGTTVPPPVKL